MAKSNISERLGILLYGGALLVGLASGIAAEFWPMGPQVGRIMRVTALLLPATIGLSLLVLLIRHRRKMRMLQRFTTQLGRGEFPPPLRIQPSDGVWIAELKTSLNYLCDRFHSTVARLKNSNDREQEMRKSIEQRASLKSKIFSHMIPELRMPLNRINGATELIRRNGASPEAMCAQICDNLRLGSHLINRLCEIASLGDSTREPVLRPFSLSEFWKQLIDSNMPLIHENHCELDGELQSDLPEQLQTDRDLLMQLLTILIRAISRTSSNGERISCRCVRHGKKIEFRIYDHRRTARSETLADKYNSQIGNPVTSQSDDDMMVLGLTFASAQAEKISGTLSASSTGESHTVLILSFDEWTIAGTNNEIPKSGARSASNRKPEPQSNSEQHDKLSSQKRRILIIGRDEVEVGNYAKLFAARNYAVETASLDSYHFHTVEVPSLLLLILPEPAGCVLGPFEAKIKNYSSVPILVLHGLLSADEKRYLNLFNWRHTLTQPVDFERLFQNADTLCG